MTRTLQKNIRVLPDQWDRIEAAAKDRDLTANQLLVELAMEALDRREWPQTDLETIMLRSCVFTAQATARALVAAGREEEIAEIQEGMSSYLPPLPGHL